MLGMNKRNLLVKFIGKSPWYDHLYKTDLTFQPNQVREMPEHFARKFLHHIDMFQLVEKEQPKQEKAEGEDANPGNFDAGDIDTDTDTDTDTDNQQDGEGSESGEGQDAEDDTAAILENSQAKNEEEAEEDASNLLHDTLAQVNQMSQPALVDFALQRYNIKIAKRTKVDDARATVTNLVNQYGVL